MSLLTSEEKFIQCCYDVLFPNHLRSQMLSLCQYGGGKIPPGIDIVLIFFQTLVFQEYWVLVESRVPLKPMLGGVRIFVLSISSHDKTQ